MDKQFEKYKKLGGKFADDWNEHIFSKITDEEDTSGIKLKHIRMHCQPFMSIHNKNPNNSIKLSSSSCNKYISAIYAPKDKIEHLILNDYVVFKRKDYYTLDIPIEDLLKDARTIPFENKDLIDCKHQYKDEIFIHGEVYSRIILAYPCFPIKCGKGDRFIQIDSECKEPFDIYIEMGETSVDISKWEYITKQRFSLNMKFVMLHNYYKNGILRHDSKLLSHKLIDGLDFDNIIDYPHQNNIEFDLLNQ